MQTEKGFLIVNVYVDNIAQPINRAQVEVIGQNITTYTNIDGTTNPIELDAPAQIYSETPQTEIKPYATYDIRVQKEGLVPTTVQNVQIFPQITSTQDVYLSSNSEENVKEDIVDVEDITLWANYPPNIDNNEEIPTNSTRVLPTTFIPEYIIVHDGIPTNTNASNYYVSFPDYVKNVASSEIYSTWPKEAIKANINAIASFALNRIYTEWYPSKGYNFTITATTTYDQKYTHGRTIFAPISEAVDEYFNQYIKIGSNNYPLLAQYNDGINVNEPGRLSQWGSKSLGDRGYNALQILRYYYGNNTNIDTAPLQEGFPSSFPGYNLTIGSCGEEVQKMQSELNIIRSSYPKIPIIASPNGQFSTDTANSVRVFQEVFKLPVTGIIDFSTWYKISYVYTAVSNMTKGIYD